MAKKIWDWISLPTSPMTLKLVHEQFDCVRCTNTLKKPYENKITSYPGLTIGNEYYNY